MLDLNQQVPNFTLPDQSGKPFELYSSPGPWTALYFYPAASTPGCTTQACGVQQSKRLLEASGIFTVGVSADPLEAVAEFADQYNLSFPLLADADASVCELYGVWSGRWARRTTFLLDSQFKLVGIMEDVDPQLHASRLVEMVEEMP